MSGRDQLPHDLYAERIVLGCMMTSPIVIPDVLGRISGNAYFRPAHKRIHEAIVALSRRDEPTDPVAVKSELERHRALTRIGGADYLHTLYSVVPLAANADYYARIVAGHAERRRVIVTADRLRQAAADLGEPLDMLRMLIRSELAGYQAPSDGNDDILRDEHQMPLEVRRWNLRGSPRTRETFGQPHPDDFPGT